MYYRLNNMRHSKIINYLILLLFFPCFALYGQTDETAPRDMYSLLTMPYNRRPLQLYRGQLQATPGFRFDIRTHIYDNQGNNIRNKSSDVAFVRYHFPVEIKYGITDFIEAGIGISHLRAGMRNKSTGYAGPNIMVNNHTLYELRGMTDLGLYTSLRLPVEYKFFDMNISGGIFLPTAKHRPAQPKHSTTTYYYMVEEDVTAEYNINYHYVLRNGSGVPEYRLASSGKLTLQKLSLQIDGAFLFPAKSGKNIRWSHTILKFVDSEEFSYTKEEYGYLNDRRLHFDATMHFQVNGWLDAHITGGYFSSRGGWTEHYGQKYAHPQQTLLTLSPGFSIQVSPTVRFYQSVDIPLSGKNTDGHFAVSIAASFNLFPFLKQNTQ